MVCCWQLIILTMQIWMFQLQRHSVVGQFAQGRCPNGPLNFDLLEIRDVRSSRKWFSESEAGTIIECIQDCRQISNFCNTIGFISADIRRQDSKNICLFSYASARGCNSRDLVNRVQDGNRNAVVECIRCPTTEAVSSASRRASLSRTPVFNSNEPSTDRQRATERTTANVKGSRIHPVRRKSKSRSENIPLRSTQTPAPRGPRVRLRITANPRTRLTTESSRHRVTNRIRNTPAQRQRTTPLSRQQEKVTTPATVRSRTFTRRPAITVASTPSKWLPRRNKSNAKDADKSCWRCDETKKICLKQLGTKCSISNTSSGPVYVTEEGCLKSCRNSGLKESDSTALNDSCYACNPASGFCIGHTVRQCKVLDRPRYDNATICAIAGCSRTATITKKSGNITSKSRENEKSLGFTNCYQCFDVLGQNGRIVPPRFAFGSLTNELPPQTANCWAMENPQATKMCNGQCITMLISSKKLPTESQSAQSFAIVADLLRNFGLGEMEIVIRNCSSQIDHSELQSSDQFIVKSQKCFTDRCNDQPADVTPVSNLPDVAMNNMTWQQPDTEFGNLSTIVEEMEPIGEGGYLCHACFDVFGKHGRVTVPQTVEAVIGRSLPNQMANCWNNPSTVKRCTTPCSTTTGFDLDPSLGLALPGANRQTLSMDLSQFGKDKLSIVIRNCSGVEDEELDAQLDATAHVCAHSADLGVQSNLSICICKSDLCNKISSGVDIPGSAVLDQAVSNLAAVVRIDANPKRWQCFNGVTCTSCSVGECVLELSAWNSEEKCTLNCPETSSCWFCDAETFKCKGALASPCSFTRKDPLTGPFPTENKCIEFCKEEIKLVTMSSINQRTKIEERISTSTNSDIVEKPLRNIEKDECQGPISFIIKKVAEAPTTMQFRTKMAVTSVAECAFLCYSDSDCDNAAIMQNRGDSSTILCFLGLPNESSMDCNADHNLQRDIDYTENEPVRIGCFECYKKVSNQIKSSASVIVRTNNIENSVSKTVDAFIEEPADSLASSQSTNNCNGTISFVIKDENTTKTSINFLAKLEVLSVSECAFLCFANPDCSDAAVLPIESNESAAIMCYFGTSNGETELFDCDTYSKEFRIRDHSLAEPVRIGCFGC